MTSGPQCTLAGVFTVIKPVDESTIKFVIARGFVRDISKTKGPHIASK
jgi:hypothetical protein